MAENENELAELPKGPIYVKNAAIRYYSRGGNVEAMAEALSRGAGVPAISVDEEGAELTEPVDLLFIGGALYAWKLDQHLVDYIENLDPNMVGTAICFGSSMLFRRPVLIIQDLLRKKGIAINQQAIYSRNHPNEALEDAIEFFAKNEMTRDHATDGLAPWQISKYSREQKEAREAAEEEAELLSEAEQAALEAAEQAEAAEREAAEAQARAEAAKAAAEAALAEAEAAAAAAAAKAEEAAAAAASAEAEAGSEDL